MEKIIEKIFKISKGIDTEILLNRRKSYLTRFGDNEISQNVYSNETSASIRILKNNKVFKFSINQFDEETIKNSFNKALESLKFQKEDKSLLPLIKTSVKINNSRYYDENTSNLSPSFRAQKIKELTKLASSKKLISYGILSNGENDLIIANSNGVLQKHKESSIEYEITIKDQKGYGYASEYSFKNDIDFKGINEKAIQKAILSKNPISIKPGKYTVILEPDASVELLSFLSYYGFSGQLYVENKSFVNNNLGKKMFNEDITIMDNALDGPSSGMGFDFEGYPKEKVELISKGVIKTIVTDRKVASLTKLRNTGHSLPQPNSSGPVPINVVMQTGKTSLENMIKDSDNALLITQFHYTNCLKPKDIEMTGMTRNGTFLIKNGKIHSAVKNLRFTQSAVEAFKNIENIENKSKVFNSYFGRTSCPSLKIKNFNFSSVTDF